VEGTLLGASSLLHQSSDSAEDLRRAVTSPGGTTEQAIGVFDNRDVAGILEEARHELWHVPRRWRRALSPPALRSVRCLRWTQTR
jgi:Pyrroline-5-carboxylate reductase